MIFNNYNNNNTKHDVKLMYYERANNFHVTYHARTDFFCAYTDNSQTIYAINSYFHLHLGVKCFFFILHSCVALRWRHDSSSRNTLSIVDGRHSESNPNHQPTSWKLLSSSDVITRHLLGTRQFVGVVSLRFRGSHICHQGIMI